MCPCSCDNLKPVSTALFHALDSGGTNHVKTRLQHEGWARVFVSPSASRYLLPCTSAVPAALMVSTALDIWSAGCSSGVFLIPELFLCVQDDAVPIGIAYERLQAGPDAAPGNSSSLCIAEQKGCFLKVC